MDYKIGILGLGYVGLPLAVGLSRSFSVVGFDPKIDRVSKLKSGFDVNLEISRAELKKSNIEFSNDPRRLKGCNVFIITVPTPVDDEKSPDLNMLISATELASKHLEPDGLVIIESTVYPGVSRNVCLPVLERSSGLKINRDFGLGYSPERVNPGDRKHTIEKVTKLISASDAKWLERVKQIYSSIAPDLHLCDSIEIAEAAKVIENTQRDINIALMNELAMLFHKLEIDTRKVLDACKTKWNFLDFYPGLVGGHCIGVDPYYLATCSREVGLEPRLITAGRMVNEIMVDHVVDRLKSMLVVGQRKGRCRLLVLGITFKANVPDLRNAKVFEVIRKLHGEGVTIDVCDPFVDSETLSDPAISRIFKMTEVAQSEALNQYSAILVAVPHDLFKDEIASKLENFCESGGVVFSLGFMLKSGRVSYL